MTTDTIIDIGNIVFEEREINPSQLGISSRQINYWIHNKIVPFADLQEPAENTLTVPSDHSKKTTKTKWVRLNLAQAVWVSIVNELFKFKVPLTTMQELAYEVWQRPREEHYADKIFQHHLDKNSNNLPKLELDKLSNHLKDELLMEYHFRTIINPFTDMVKSAIYRTSSPHTLLYVPESNDYEFRYGDSSLVLDLASVFLQNPMISLPIGPIISKVLLVDFDNKKKKDLSYLTNIEKQLRDIVVFKRPKVVEIAFEDNNIEPIVVTEKHQSREQLSKYILNNKIEKGSKLLIDIRSNDHYKITLIKK